MIKVRNLDTTTTPEPPQTQTVPCASLPSGNRQAALNPVQEQARIAARLGAEVTITGQWAWAQFSSKPVRETLDTLKGNGWIWCHNKGKWAYRGTPSTSRKAMPWEYITQKYGEQKVEEREEVLVK